MTPKEKAEQLVESLMLWKFQKCELSKKQAKQCALIAVDEIDRVLQSASTKEDPYVNLLSLEYWQEVKHEIELL